MNSSSMLEQYLQQQRLIGGSLLYFNAESDIAHAGPYQLESSELSNRATSVDEREMVLSTSPSSPTTIEQASDIRTSNTTILETNSTMPKVTSWQKAETLTILRDQICNCMNCELGATRNKFVFGVGNPQADIVVIGEAPGADEDAQGEPFVGRAGQLLTKILEAVQFPRDEVFICNILKCRPPGNRTPVASEVDECEPYLYKQLELIQPKFILALGLTAVNTLLKSKFKMADVRGKYFNYQNIRMMVTYHPAALLRNPEWKKSTWEDVQLLRRSYDLYLTDGSLPSFHVLK